MDLSGLTLADLKALDLALRAAIAAGAVAGGGFEVALTVDEDGVSVTFSINPERDAD